MLFSLAVLLCVCCGSFADWRCSNGAENEVTFAPVGGAVVGRYLWQWCKQLDKSVNRWKLSVDYFENRNSTQCHNSSLYRTSKPSRRISHSSVTEYVHDINCTNVCFSRELDLIFNNTCYRIQNTLFKDTGITSRTITTAPNYFYFVNTTVDRGADYFSETKTSIDTEDVDEHSLRATWFLGRIPSTMYEMKLCPIDEGVCDDVEENCTTIDGGQHISCMLSGVRGCGVMRFSRQDPWINGVGSLDAFKDHLHVDSKVCVHRSPPPAVETAWVSAWRWGGGLVLGVGALALAFAALRRARASAAKQKQVLHTWLHRNDSESGPKPEPVGPLRILVLYARDAAPATRAVEELKAMLELIAPGEVVDLFSAESVREYACAPAEWVRATLAAPRTRCVLVVTPAAAALYRAALSVINTHSPTMEQPLLGSRVMYRRPQFGDALLHFALKLLADSAHDPLSYKKFYIATLNGVEAEIGAQLQPFRRYCLPAAAPALLQHLSGVTDLTTASDLLQPAQAVQLELHSRRLADAARDLHKHATDNPAYLRDELLLLDT